jgi:hypothetical protein
MEFDFGLLGTLAAALAAVGMVVVQRTVHGRIRTILMAGVIGVTATLVLRTFIGSSTATLLLAQADYPVKSTSGGYVSSDQCKACHPREYQTWHSSYHRTMTQRPTPESVAGVFGVSLRKGEERFDLSERDGRYFVDMPAPPWWRGSVSDGRIERPVELMTGSHNYQVYWVSSGNSRVLSQMPYVYLIAEKLWVPRQSVFMIPPDEVLGSEYGRWNSTCIQCHTTFGRPMQDPAKPDAALTEIGEYGIACEACHGPGDGHVRAMLNPMRRYAAHLGYDKVTAITNPTDLSAEQSAHVCGQCHSVHALPQEEIDHWMASGLRFRPGDDLRKTRAFLSPAEARSDPDHFWPDGAVRVTGRELNGLLESPCFAGGKFSCLSCHEPHKQESDPRSLEEWRVSLLRPFEEGNGQCLQCHEKIGAALTKHTHHAEESSGSACVNCHMPHTVYGLGKAARDHRISSPSIATELATGRPNACNLCHIDRTLAWAGGHLSGWYGATAPALSEDQREVAASLSWLYRGDAHQRALAMWAMGWPSARAVAGEEWVAPHLARAIGDPYQVLGLVAWRSLRKIFGNETMPGRVLMRDPSMRIQAAQAALDLQPVKRTGQELLIGPDGRLDNARIERLLQQRDNRPVRLSE